MALALQIVRGPATCQVRPGDAFVWHPPESRHVGQSPEGLVVDDGTSFRTTAISLGRQGPLYGRQRVLPGELLHVGPASITLEECHQPPELQLRRHRRLRLSRVLRLGTGPRGQRISVWDAVAADGRLVTATVDASGRTSTGPRISGLPLARLVEGGQRLDEERAAAIALAAQGFLLGSRLRLNFDGIVVADWTTTAPAGRQLTSRGSVFAVLTGQMGNARDIDVDVDRLNQRRTVGSEDLAWLARSLAAEQWDFESQWREEVSLLAQAAG